MATGSAGAYQTVEYRAAKVRLRGAPCWMCKQPSDTIDHVPSLAAFPHWRLWRGELRPACGPCNFRAGQAVSAERRRIDATSPHSERW